MPEEVEYSEMRADVRRRASPPARRRKVSRRWKWQWQWPSVHWRLLPLYGLPLLALWLVPAMGFGPGADWQFARAVDTVAAYEEFLGFYPQSRHETKAHARIRELQEQTAWQQAQQAGTVIALETFLRTYPDSPQAGQAAAALTVALRRQLWDRLATSQDQLALELFARQYAGTEEALAAQTHLERLRAGLPLETPPVGAGPAQNGMPVVVETPLPPPSPDATHRVQLAALGSEQTAQAGVAQLTAALRDVLGDVRLEVHSSTTSSYYLVQTPALRRNEAEQLCEALQRRGQDCFLVPL